MNPVVSGLPPDSSWPHVEVFLDKTPKLQQSLFFWGVVGLRKQTIQICQLRCDIVVCIFTFFSESESVLLAKCVCAYKTFSDLKKITHYDLN